MFRPVVSPIAVLRPAASCSPPALRRHLSRAAPHRAGSDQGGVPYLSISSSCSLHQKSCTFIWKENWLSGVALSFRSCYRIQKTDGSVALQNREPEAYLLSMSKCWKSCKKWNYNRLVRAMFVSPAGWMVDKRRSASLISAGVKDELMLFRIRFTLISF
jgi:hypothetical protein